MNVVTRPYVSLCAGGGGLDLAIRRAVPDARCVLYVENEVSSACLLAARIADGSLDDAPIWSDLKTIDVGPWRGKVDGIIGSYPCQPFSNAGQRRGVTDPWHLWPYIVPIIEHLRPRWCFFENVEGHVRLGYPDVVLPDLQGLGYSVEAGIFAASEVGAPHRRERLFILAINGVGLADARRDQRDGRRAVRPADGGAEGTPGEDESERAERERPGILAGDGSAAGGLADAASPRHAGEGQHGGRPSPLPARPEQRGEPVDDAKGQGWRQRAGRPAVGDEPAQPGPEQPGADAEVEHADRSGRDGRTSAERQAVEERRGQNAEPRPSRYGLGDADIGGRREAVDGLPGQPQPHAPRPGQWPPAPNDAEGWARVLAVRPDLAPAVESRIRRVADGASGRLDLPRADRLRILGNGVVPDQAAYAFRILAERHGLTP